MSSFTRPYRDGFAMPAEWAPQQAVWMIWPYRQDNWRSSARPAQQAFASVAAAIARTTSVFMAVPASEMVRARQAVSPLVTLVEMESDDAWMRDTGPTIVVNQQGERRAVSWTFNAWGGKLGGLYASWEHDQAIAGQVAGYHMLPCYNADLVLEGGSVHTDGEGTLLTTAECLLHRNRNPQLTQSEIEQALRDYLGVEAIIWLPEGVFNDETNGHIDNICCFVRPGEVALHWTEDRHDPQYTRSVAALKVLEAATDARGRSLKIWKIPAPDPLYATDEETRGLVQGTAAKRQAGDRLAGSYVNYLISNGQIIFPLLDPQTDQKVEALFREIYPDHLVTGVPAREILLGGGNIHCITQQIPA